MNFNNEYKKIKSLISNELLQIEKKLTDSINVQPPLNNALKEFLTLPSKRIRSVIPILFEKSQNIELSDSQLEFLAIIELIHNASLIHDDIIDECQTRRGHKTIGADFDNKLAVISGDYILSVCIQKLTEIGNLKLINEISKTINSMCVGEINQNFNLFKLGTIEDYIEKTKNKTAHLFKTALFGTSLLGEKQNLHLAQELGLNIGIAFQIRDDILNFTSSQTDKPINNDLTQGIYNAPVILGNKDDNYQSGIEKTKILLNNYTNKAKKLVLNLEQNAYQNAILKFLELLEDV